MEKDDDDDAFYKALAMIFLAFVMVLLSFVTIAVLMKEDDREINSRWEEFTLIGLDPPKHFYVDLENERGEVMRRVFVSKHCNTWRELRIGQKLRLEIKTFQKAGTPRTYEEVQVRNNRVCPLG